MNLGNTKKRNTGDSSKGFTLFEVLVVLVIFAVSVALFHTVFVTNWMAYQHRIIKADLWQESNRIIEEVSFDTRNGRTINVSDDARTASILDINNNLIATYQMTSNGDFQIVRPNGTQTLSSNVDLASSSFSRQGRSLRLVLVLQQPSFTGTVSVVTTTETFPRN